MPLFKITPFLRFGNFQIQLRKSLLIKWTGVTVEGTAAAAATKKMARNVRGTLATQNTSRTAVNILVLATV